MTTVVNFSELFSKTNRGGKAGDPNKCFFATDRSFLKNGKYSYSLRVSIPECLVKQARLIKGDRVNVSYHVDDRLLVISRCHDGRWSLSQPGAHRTSKKLGVQITYIPGCNMPTVAKGVACDSIVTENGIALILPECVSHTENLREIAKGI